MSASRLMEKSDFHHRLFLLGSAISPLAFLSVFREMDRQGDLPIRTALTQSVGIAVFPYEHGAVRSPLAH